VEALSASTQEHGILLVFLNVLIQQLGVPVPVLPTMMVAGALSVTGVLSMPAVLGAAIVASLLADGIWYAIGIRFGSPVLARLCRMSLSPDSCVRQSEDRIGRWGAWALVIGKFVPGLSLMAPPIAGIVGLRPAVFVSASAAAAALYFGLGLALGRVFHGQINEVLDIAERHGTVAAVVLAALLAAYVGYRWLRRWQFLRRLRLARITVDELRQRIERGAAPAILDVRSAIARERRPGIPGALSLNSDAIEPARLNLAPGQEIVVYCNCPNEASAALVAKRLIEAGFTNVRPLKGGLDAWIAAGPPAGAAGGAGDQGARR
jgi:membrane protein DedA with SNARE-associated domain/rhodanese-related sulfurtransferase